jgi:dolichyl-phosphate-mannose-protein mannosyltransferase
MPSAVQIRWRARDGLWAMALVGFLAIVNYCVGLNNPPGTVWDESYYLTTTERYSEGVAQFASHPPLGLMLIALGNRVFSTGPQPDTRALGRVKSVKAQMLPAGYSFAPMRSASAIFAVFGAMAFFVLMRFLTSSTFAALAFSNLFIFENAFVAQFRAAQLDVFQIAFAVVALLLFTLAVKREPKPATLLDAGFGISCGLAMMVKLNAAILALLGAMLIVRRVMLAWRWVPTSAPLLATRYRLLWTATRNAAVMAGSCVATLVAVFTVHLLVSSHAMSTQTPAGQKDEAFLSAPYRDYLDGKRTLTPAVAWSAAADYWRFMVADLEGIPRADRNGSNPIEWPLGVGAINYRWDSDGTRTAYVQLVGNRVGWLLACTAPFAATALLILQWRLPVPSSDPARRPLMVMLLIEYVAFMGLHQYLSHLRVMYLYHYFIGLLLAFSLLPLVFAEAVERWEWLRDRQSAALGAMTAALLVSFVFYAPLSYHRPLTHGQCELRNLFEHVVDCRP